ncbi:MAG: nucleotidyltransferase domain-containing protein [Candidatus Undinarchaeales archaeon]|nr:nucleotidyltransferase domain-containing protein [Candidatus Undinarchaeales archaeon]MDP7491370.1 nucleotidyltransferase domain-containing protein [Candidatus Undinarchaeales archaeon]
MLEIILGSRTRTRVLSLLLLSPDTPLHVRELARRSDVNINAVRRELARLLRAGIVRSSSKGNLLLYEADPSSPIFDELRSMFLKTEGLVGALAKTLSGMDGIEKAFVFGSFASNEVTLQSDVDLIVVGSVDEDRLMHAARELKERFSREVNYILLSSEEYDRRRSEGDPFVSNVLYGRTIPLVGDAPEA